MKLYALYVDLSPKSNIRKFVLHRKNPKNPLHETFESFKVIKKIDLVKNILDSLAKEETDFYEKLCEIDLNTCESQGNGRSQRYFVKNKLEISDTRSIQSIDNDNYWLNGNCGSSGTKTLLREACEAANIRSVLSFKTLKIGNE